MLENYHDKESVGQKLQDLEANKAAMNNLTHGNDCNLEQKSDINLTKLLMIGVVTIAVVIVLGFFAFQLWQLG